MPDQRRFKTRIRESLEETLFQHLAERNIGEAISSIETLLPLYKRPGYDKLILQSISFIVTFPASSQQAVDPTMLGHQRRLLEQLFASDPRNRTFTLAQLIQLLQSQHAYREAYDLATE